MNRNLPKVGQPGKKLNLKVPEFKVPQFKVPKLYKPKNPLPKLGKTPAGPVKGFDLNNFINNTTLRRPSSSQSGGALRKRTSSRVRGPNVPVSQSMTSTEAKAVLKSFYEAVKAKAAATRKAMRKLNRDVKSKSTSNSKTKITRNSRKVNSAPVVRPKSAGPSKSKVSSATNRPNTSGGRRGSAISDRRRQRGMLVRRVMSEKGLSLPDASSYIKVNGLMK